ncbi:3-hydroxyacyl-CoA dehydrogenase family protein [Agathobaculum sp. Marseille-P7918]|uniref:3-hydroxyacyl-CoA dehydrogenase family protein n=1 Tax=Agathobaculum sp. Marseille-P7918 TaxID=2479843 RepID=UPI000F63548C|nr:3-hydroxyacyl-CoA dehydrogenase family protein [Agathobaculum sp. Marseille-P7918]
MLNYKTGVVGAGRVGAGMATLMAGHGCEVTIVGLDEDDLQRCRGILEGNLDELVQQGLATEKNRAAILRRFTLTTDTTALKGCMFVLEAAFENLDVKKGIYRQVEAVVSPDTLMASTTSAISVELLTADMAHPERFAVTHPFQPAHMLPLVELVGGPNTAPETIDRLHAFLEELDREVVTLHKSVPGFIINRLAQALFRESLYLVEQGVVSVADVDKAIKYAVGMRYASIGLLEYFDDVGFSLERDIAQTVYPDLCSTRAIQQIVLDGLASGKTGRSVGLGLYDWSKKDDADYLRRKAAPYYACFHWDMPEA